MPLVRDLAALVSIVAFAGFIAVMADLAQSAVL